MYQATDSIEVAAKKIYNAWGEEIERKGKNRNETNMPNEQREMSVQE